MNHLPSDTHARKQRASLVFAGILSFALVAFIIVRVTAPHWVSQILFPGVSVYTALMILLSVGAWLLTWAYIARIQRIERAAAHRTDQGVST